MSAQRKQYADLIRHRELNALRRVMVGRQTPLPSIRPSLSAGRRVTQQAGTDALSNIDELETQMNQSLFERSLRALELTNTSAINTPTAQTVHLGQTAVPGTPVRATANTAPEQITLDQAANWFADNRMLDVQTLLTQALGAQGALHAHIPTWLALFDFYRATDQPSLFDSLALDFSVRFGRSTPSWVSLPALAERVQMQAKSSLDPMATMAVNQPIARCDWAAPSYLSEGALAGFDVLVHNAAMNKRSLHLDWRGLVAVDPAQWSTIKNQLNTIAAHKLRCVMYGIESLSRAVSSDLAEAVLAQMALLRCQNQAYEFEELAMDYCVAFEISPPDWMPPVCLLELQDSPLEEAHFTSEAPADVAVAPANLSALTLSGEVIQLPSDWPVMESRPMHAQQWVVDCAALVRIAPSATQALLSWVRQSASDGVRVAFTDVHRLIAVYFLAQGLYECATVSLRKD
jgi:hypothetical protein